MPDRLPAAIVHSDRPQQSFVAEQQTRLPLKRWAGAVVPSRVSAEIGAAPAPGPFGSGVQR